MSTYIDPVTVERILSTCQILDIVRDHVPDLKKKGGNWWAKSPFKEEKTPSFSVNPARNIFKCFATGKGGNAAKFLQEIDPSIGSWLEAMHVLAERYNIEVSTNQTPEEKAAAVQAKKKLDEALEVYEFAAKYYQKNLFEHETGKALIEGYLIERGIDLSDAEDWGLGLSLLPYNALIQASKEDVDPGLLLQSGLAKKHENGTVSDFFRNRLMIPIHNHKGQVIGFGARRLKDEGPKYINSSESSIYKKSEILYGWHMAKDAIYKADQAILTEGYFDVILPHTQGVNNVVGLCGTALTIGHIKRIKPYTINLVLAFDADSAGQRATLKAIDLALAEGMNPEPVAFPEGEDPASFALASGPEQFTAFIEKQKSDWLDYKFEFETQEKDLSKPHIKQSIAISITTSLKLIKESIIRDGYIDKAAELLALDRQHIVNLIEGKSGGSSQSGSFFQAGPLSFEAYLRFCASLGLEENPDFSRAPDGSVRIQYLRTNGDPFKHRQGQTEVETVRVTSKFFEVKGAYIPRSLRAGGKLRKEIEETPDLGLPLLFVQDELTAWTISELGIPAIGFNQPEGFIAGRASKKLHRTVKEVLNIGFDTIIFLLPGEAYQLPKVERVPDTPLYQDTDAANTGKKYVEALVTLNQSIRKERVLPWVMYANPLNDEIYPSLNRWLEDALLSFQKENDLQEWFREEVFRAMSPDPGPLFRAMDIKYSIIEDFQQILHLTDPQKFYEYHGFQALGSEFKLNGAIYKVDHRTQKVERKSTDEEARDVWAYDGRLWANQKGSGIKAISNFMLECELKVTDGDDTYGIYAIRHYQRKTQIFRTQIEAGIFTERSKFFRRIKGIPGANLWWGGSAQNLVDVDLLIISKNPPEAQNMTGTLGWHTENKFWVWGNGISDRAGKFRPISPEGILSINGSSYFLPALSNIRYRSDHDRHYETERLFSYQESPITYKDWMNKFYEVYGMTGHVGFMFALKSLFRDITVSKIGRDPHLFCLGEKGSGKGAMVESLAALFGDLKQLNLNDDPTVPALRKHFSTYSNCLAIFNEVNPSSVRPWMITAFKAPYDNQLRAKMSSGSSFKKIDYGVVSSSSVLMGQESSIYLQEAVAVRCNFIQFTQVTRTEEAERKWLALGDIEAEGLSHILTDFLRHRGLIEEHFKKRMERIMQRLKKQTKGSESIDTRLFLNWAIMMAPLFLLMEEEALYYPLSQDEIYDHAADQIELHAKNMVAKGLLDIFFNEFIQGHMYDIKYGLTDNHIFHDKTKNILAEYPEGVYNLQLKNIYPRFRAFLKYTYDSSIENATSTDLKRRLKNHPAFIDAVPVAWLGFKRETLATGKQAIAQDAKGAGKRHYSSALRFDASKLELSIPQNFTFETEEDEEPKPTTSNGTPEHADPQISLLEKAANPGFRNPNLL